MKLLQQGERRLEKAEVPFDRKHALRSETARKAVHVLVSCVAIALVWLTPGELSRAVIGAAAILAIGLDLLRLRAPALGARFTHWFAPMLRTRERVQFTGATTLAIGFAAAVLLFPRSYAIVGMVYAGVADAVGAVVGVRFGRHALNAAGKTVEGSGAFLLTAFLLGMVVPHIGPGAAGVAAAVATLVEAFSGLDDNLVLPVIGAGAVATAAFVLA